MIKKKTYYKKILSEIIKLYKSNYIQLSTENYDENSIFKYKIQRNFIES